LIPPTDGIADTLAGQIKYANSHSREILAGNRRHAWSRTLSRTRNAIMIDISTLKNITVDTEANTVTVGGGVSVGDVMPALQAVGKETSEYIQYMHTRFDMILLRF
jgi:FAD/FMN-containing dehydrogenase